MRRVLAADLLESANPVAAYRTHRSSDPADGRPYRSDYIAEEAAGNSVPATLVVTDAAAEAPARADNGEGVVWTEPNGSTR